MHTKGPKEDPLVDMGFETRDINYPALGKTAVFFFIFGIFCFGVVGVWFVFAKPKISAELEAHKGPLPTILLQSNMTVRTDIQEFRQAETKTLSNYGKNPDGSFRIPIDKAMDDIAQRGLQHAVTETPATSPGNTVPQNALAPGEHAAPTPPENPPTIGAKPGGAASQP